MNEHISRRSFLRATAAGAATVALGALSLSQSAAAATTIHKGADISWAPQMEAHGYYWRNASGVRQDILTILKGYGLSAIRLRTFVNPSSDPANGHCDINETAAMALRVQDAGMAVNIDYHFSDTWADEGHQYPPAAWKNMSYSQMRGAIASYVNSTMNVIKSKGVTPTWVQIGNEINSGICHPVGSVSNPRPDDRTAQRGVRRGQECLSRRHRDAFTWPRRRNPRCDASSTRYSAHGGEWDMNGFSSYGSASLAASLVNDMKSISTPMASRSCRWSSADR